MPLKCESYIYIYNVGGANQHGDLRSVVSLVHILLLVCIILKHSKEYLHVLSKNTL